MYGYYGIYHKSLYEVSQTLSQLKLCFSIYGAKFNQYKKVSFKKRQVVPIYLVESLKRAERLHDLEPGLMIICDSTAALKRSNTSKLLYPGIKLKQAISKAYSECNAKRKSNKLVQLNTTPLRLQEVLKVATTYSFLNGIQTALYKITPYSLRKETQQIIISYFYGDLSYSKLIDHLKSSSKLKTLLTVCKDKQAKLLRQACIEAIDNPAKIESIAKASGFASFEIAYIIKSHQKTLESSNDN